MWLPRSPFLRRVLRRINFVEIDGHISAHTAAVAVTALEISRDRVIKWGWGGWRVTVLPGQNKIQGGHRSGNMKDGYADIILRRYAALRAWIWEVKSVKEARKASSVRQVERYRIRFPLGRRPGWRAYRGFKLDWARVGVYTKPSPGIVYVTSKQGFRFRGIEQYRTYRLPRIPGLRGVVESLRELETILALIAVGILVIGPNPDNDPPPRPGPKPPPIPEPSPVPGPAMCTVWTPWGPRIVICPRP